MSDLKLFSNQPHPDIPDADRIFAPFIGSWDLRVTWYEDDDIVRQEDGEWHFSWVLEGRGVQDVWIVPPRRARTDNPYEYGTSVRFYDPGLGAWRSTWIGPMHGVVRTFVARKIDNIVMLETEAAQGDPMRWIFSDIDDDGFVWRNMVLREGTWVLQQDFIAKRMALASSKTT